MCPSPKQSTRDWIWIPGILVGNIPIITPLGELLALRISARGIWAHIQIQWLEESVTEMGVWYVVCTTPTSRLSHFM